MKLRKKASLEFEFDRFRFAFRKRVPDVAEKLRSLFVGWTREREADRTCACVVKDLVIGPSENPRQVDVLCGWFCDRRLNRLETAVSDRLSEAIGVYVGTDLSRVRRWVFRTWQSDHPKRSLLRPRNRVGNPAAPA